MAKILCFECSKCGERQTADVARNVCPKDGGPLYVRYDLASIRETVSRESVSDGPASMWRYSAVFPDVEPVTLGEGMTPMLPSRKYQNVLIKDEGLNPTGSFKARGMSAAVAMARHYRLKKVAAPSAGNAGGALAAYAAAAGIEAFVFMPKDVPLANRLEVEASGAHLTLVDGLISDCGRMVAERKDAEGWFDVSTLKEPFRVEGKKTMGYEVAEQMGWRLPDAILYPTGGGVGLIGMWKAFAEMEDLDWIEKGHRPKMISIQASGCAPIIKALHEGTAVSEMWPDAHTLAAGLRVPKAYGDFIILDIIRQSGGTAIAVNDDRIMSAVKELASTEGIFAAPEGGAALAAYQELLDEGFLKESDEVVLFNTGSGYKYLDTFASYWGVTPFAPPIKLPASRNIGGIIGPYRRPVCHQYLFRAIFNRMLSSFRFLSFLAIIGPLLCATASAQQRTYLGMDRNDYPGDANMQLLRKTFVFTGYWLNTPPGADRNNWAGKRGQLQSMGFGFLLLFNGREYKELTASGDSSGVGLRDAAEAVQAASKDGFPKRAIIFLDQEQGGRMLPEQRAYIHAWIDGVVKGGYRAGVYCSGIPYRESTKTSVVTANDIRDNAGDREIHFFISNDHCGPAPGCVLPTHPPIPVNGGVAFAELWQYAQSPRRPEMTAACRQTYAPDNNCYPPGIAASIGLHIDVDSADSPDPSQGRSK